MMAEIVPVKIMNMSSLLSRLGSIVTMTCIFAYFAVVAPATDAGERERAAHMAVREYKVELHAGITGSDDPYHRGSDDLYDDDDDDDDDDDESDTGAVARMIAVSNGEVVEWVFGPRPLWWEIGSLGDWGDLAPEELNAGIRQALKVLSAGAVSRCQS